MLGRQIRKLWFSHSSMYLSAKINYLNICFYKSGEIIRHPEIGLFSSWIDFFQIVCHFDEYYHQHYSFKNESAGLLDQNTHLLPK
jgi:hypothetical protein